ncbi:MAG: hypothetical protein ACJAQ3_003051, partial [Planctomycetota bacterium]
MNLPFEFDRFALSRRTFLGGAAAGLGQAALASLSAPAPVAPRAKRVIHLYMAGGPSHLETFDEKPELAKLDGQPMPESFTNGQQLAQLQGQQLRCLGPRFAFKAFGQSGQRLCEKFPK